MRKTLLLPFIVLGVLFASIGYSSPPVNLDVRKCPATGPGPGSGQQCGALATCSGMNLPHIEKDSCSTVDPGECEPASFKCRWSCTFTISNLPMSGVDYYICAAGVGVQPQDCKNGAQYLDPNDPSTLSFSDSLELACNTDGKFQFVFFTKDAQGNLNFACCAKYNVDCNACD